MRTPHRIAAAVLLALAATPAVAETPARIVLGVLNDMSGPYSDSAGPGSVVAARMAADEFMAAHPGVVVEVRAADHQNKADVGSAIARQWIARDGVDAILDVPTSAVGLAVNDVARGTHAALIASSTATSDLTGRYCSPNTVQWTMDTWAVARTLVQNLAAHGARTFFFIGTDNALGHSLADEATASIGQLGARVAGAVYMPINTPDYSAPLLQAAAAGADAVMFATAGADTAALIKQSAEFGLRAPGRTFAPMLLTSRDIDAAGRQAAEGLNVVTPVPAQLDAAGQAWSARFAALHRGQSPTPYQAGVYASTRAYLAAVVAAGSLDGATVVAQMKRMRFHDDLFGDVVVRADGRATHTMYLLRVKPASSGPADLYEQIGALPGDQAFRPLDQGGCKLLDSMRP